MTLVVKLYKTEIWFYQISKKRSLSVIKNAMRLSAAELICSTGVLGFQVFNLCFADIINCIDKLKFYTIIFLFICFVTCIFHEFEKKKNLLKG